MCNHSGFLNLGRQCQGGHKHEVLKGKAWVKEDGRWKYVNIIQVAGAWNLGTKQFLPLPPSKRLVDLGGKTKMNSRQRSQKRPVAISEKFKKMLLALLTKCGAVRRADSIPSLKKQPDMSGTVTCTTGQVCQCQ